MPGFRPLPYIVRYNIFFLKLGLFLLPAKWVRAMIGCISNLTGHMEPEPFSGDTK